MVASDLVPLFEEAAKQRQRESGGARWKTGAEQGKAVPADLPEANRRERKAREQAAKAVGAKGRTVSQAKAVKRDAPELADAVRSGKMSLDAADKKRKQMVANKPKPPKPPQPNATPLTLFTHKGEPVQYPKPKGRSTFNETPGDGISWAAWSWNPVTGCLHGCNYCYAREIATSKRYESAYPAGFTPLFHSERLEAPSNTSIPAKHADNPAYRRVFVCSMADLYGRWVPDEWISQVHAAMMKAPQWQYITLTKFPSRYVGLDIPDGAWVGASVDTQARVSRTEDAFAAMRELPAGRRDGGRLVKWLSIEPLLGPLEFADLSMFDWVVIGAQTRTVQPDGVVDAVAPQYDWFHSVYSQARAAGCRVHVKPNLLKSPGMVWPNEYPA